MPHVITGNMMLIDSSICMACKGCQVSCKAWHQLPAEDTSFTGTYENPADLSVDTYTRVRFSEVVGLTAFKYLEWLFFKDQCRHCTGMMGGAPCQRACPVSGAIVTEAGGAIVITDACDPDSCDRECEDACPYDIPRNDGGKEAKCDFCYDRIADGKAPSCAETCPPGAITFGTVSYIQGLANARLSELLARYPNANIYPDGAGMGGGGKKGPGHGTRVIWLLVDDPSAYGI